MGKIAERISDIYEVGRTGRIPERVIVYAAQNSAEFPPKKGPGSRSIGNELARIRAELKLAHTKWTVEPGDDPESKQKRRSQGGQSRIDPYHRFA